jgi:hypothetical protein
MLAIVGLNAMAFDSTAWFEKKRLHEREIARLKTAYGECLKKMVEPAENVTVPVEVFGDGAVRTLIKAEKAQEKSLHSAAVKPYTLTARVTF